MKYLKDGEVAVHIEWHLPLSCVHSIMMEKLAQPGGGCMPTPPVLLYPVYTLLYGALSECYPLVEYFAAKLSIKIMNFFT
jgi:hypothetical protein